MNKHFAQKDYVVVKDFKTELMKLAKHRSELTKHNTILYEGTRLECLIWSKASNKEQEKLVEEWAALRQQRRIPLPSQDVRKLDEMIDEISKKLGDIFTTSKETISRELHGKSQNAAIAHRPGPPEQVVGF
jgi:hypothetical protein